MSDDIPNLAALRADRVASDAEYIEQLEQFSLGQEREIRWLQGVVRKLADVTGASINGDWMNYGCGEFAGLHFFEPDERAAYNEALSAGEEGPK